MADKAFDPRYDPIFQRGHDDSVVRPRVSEAAPAAREPVQQPVQQPEEPAGEARLDEPPRPYSLRPATTPELSRPVVTTETFGEEPAPVTRGRVPNPFIVLLWLAGLGLVALGTVSNYRFFESQFSGPARQNDMILNQFVWALSPSAVTVGLAIIGGLLFWHAYRWQSRRAHSPVD